MKYLCDTSVSPVQQSFIEIDEPFASRVSYNISENSTSLLYFSFENVPLDKIDFIYERLIQLLVDIANGKEQIDESRLRTVFEKYILERLSSLENSPHDDVTFHVLGDFLYGDKPEDFQKRLNVTDIAVKLMDEKIDYWLCLLRKYFVDNKSITVRTVPSIAEKEKLSQEEASRLAQRRNELGEAGLAKKGRELQEAIVENDIPPPLEMLTRVPVPSTKSITYHQFDIIRKTDKSPKLDLSHFPIYIEAYNLKTNFVYITAAFDSSNVPVELRKYLLLLLDLILECPVQTKDELLPYETVVSALEHDMISYETSLGIQSSGRFGCGAFSNSVTFHMQVEVRKLEIAMVSQKLNESFHFANIFVLSELDDQLALQFSLHAGTHSHCCVEADQRCGDSQAQRLPNGPRSHQSRLLQERHERSAQLRLEPAHFPQRTRRGLER